MSTPADQQPFSALNFPTEEAIQQQAQLRFEEIRRQRELDIAEGQALAEKEFAPGSLGRVDVGRPEEVQRLIGARQSQAAAGAADAQFQRLREATQAGLSRREATAQRTLRGAQGAQGLRGGLALAGQAELAGQAALARQLAESELGREQLLRQERGQAGLEQLTQQSRAEEFAREQINQQRSLQERLGRLELPFQFAQLGAQERTAALGETRAAIQARLAAEQQQRAIEVQRIEAQKPAAQTTIKSGKVICTELHRLGYLSDLVYAGDCAYGDALKSATRNGYHLWAKPAVRLMRRSKLAFLVARALGSCWATEMAHRALFVSHGSVVGRVMSWIGEPLCWVIGKIMRKG